MEEKIRDMLEQHLFLGGLEPEEIEIAGIGDAAAEIASLVERDIASLQAVRDMYAGEIESLRAQLAEMWEALSGAKHSFARIAHGERLADKYEMMHFAQKCFEKADELLTALSAAPEVKNGRED